jgi:hypothetical protein
MVLDAPEGTEDLTCPHCGRSVPVSRYDIVIWRWDGAPRFVLRGHQETMPDPSRYDPLENFIAGAISTVPPFTTEHPASALPTAKIALEALMEWEPDD